MKLQKGLLAVLLSGAFIATACKCERKGEYAVDNTNTEAATEGDSAETTDTSKLDANENQINDVGAGTEDTTPDKIKMSEDEDSTENNPSE